MSIIVDICLIIAVLLSSVVTVPGEIVWLLTQGFGTFLLAIGILWLIGVYVRITFMSPFKPSLVCAMFFFGTGFIAVSFGAFLALLFAIFYIVSVTLTLTGHKA